MDILDLNIKDLSFKSIKEEVDKIDIKDSLYK